LQIFGEKIGGFLKIQCCGQKFAKYGFVLSRKRQFLRRIFFGEIILKIGPRMAAELEREFLGEANSNSSLN
jgi:hypothetical protein